MFSSLLHGCVIFTITLTSDLQYRWNLLSSIQSLFDLLLGWLDKSREWRRSYVTGLGRGAGAHPLGHLGRHGATGGHHVRCPHWRGSLCSGRHEGDSHGLVRGGRGVVWHGGWSRSSGWRCCSVVQFHCTLRARHLWTHALGRVEFLQYQ